MKKLFILIVLALVNFAFADDPELERMRNWSLREKLDFVQSFEPEDRSENWVKGMNALRYHFSERYSTQWAGNRSGLVEIREQVEEIRPLIIELGYSNDESYRFYAVDIGKYLKIDEQLKELLYHVVEKGIGQNGQSQVSALDAIFGYSLESEELRDELIVGLSPDPDISRQSRLGPIAMGKAGKWRLDEASEYLISHVERKYKKDGNTEHGALKSLKELGPSAISILPRIKALYEQRINDGDAGVREIEALEFSIQRIGGENQPRSTSERELSEETEKGHSDNQAHSERHEAPLLIFNRPVSWPWIAAILLIVGSVAYSLKSAKKNKSNLG